VGAFWKAGETGERIVKIWGKGDPGAWTAKVMWLDPRWGSGDGIVLSDTESPDDYLYSSNPGKAEDYQVGGYTTTVTGNTNNNGYITFRIGLKSKYTPTRKYPARYAVVLLSYANNTKHQKIFLRQGEEADYLMVDGDRIQRPKSVRFSPYNLTAAKLDATVDKSGATPVNPAIFTDFPTQAGAFFQWANGSSNPSFMKTLRWAWSPHVKASLQTDLSLSSGQYWDTLSLDNEISPVGYRRPDDGSTSAYEPNGTTKSEVRQSLFNNPIPGYNYNNYTDNSVWGYYADGFFDRHAITDNTTVSSGDRNIAYIGRLFFNPVATSDHYNASLFFPASGWLYPYLQINADGGELVCAGEECKFWTATAVEVFTNNNSRQMRASAMRLRENNAEVWKAEANGCGSIRCVKK
jgi:hypothetical protein